MTHTATTNPRQRSLAGVEAEERALVLRGVLTPVVVAGGGPPIIALHGPGGNATHWASVIPAIARTHRLIAPDLPGHGSSELEAAAITQDLVLNWLDELIEVTCDAPPILVGNALGGAIAARYAVDSRRPIARLVLVDSLGLRQFEPEPAFGAALTEFLAEPTVRTHELIWRQCALDLDRVRAQMGDRWDAFEAYNVDRAADPNVQAAVGASMAQFGFPAIPVAELDRIAAPAGLIWVAKTGPPRSRWPRRRPPGTVGRCG